MSFFERPFKNAESNHGLERVLIEPVSVSVKKTKQSFDGRLMFDGFVTNQGYKLDGDTFCWHAGEMLYVPVVESKEPIKPFDDYSKITVEGLFEFTAYYGNSHKLVGLKTIKKIPFSGILGVKQ